MIRSVLCCCLTAGLLLAQEPPVVTEPPPPPPPETGERSVPTQDPQGRTGNRGGRAGRGERGGRGRGQRQKEFELPEFTPVSAPALSALEGKQYFWFCIYPHFVVQYDPSTDQITNRIKLANGMFWSQRLTHDRKRMLVVTDQQRTIEVVDLVAGRIVGTHSFAEEGYILRIREVREMPGGAHWLIRTDRIKKEIDRYSFEAAKWLLYDTKTKKTLETLDKLPDAASRVRLSADGTHWLSSDRQGNLLFLEARKFKEIGKIDLSTPRFFGAGTLRLSTTDLLDGRDPKRALMLFTSSDPVQKSNTNWGTVEVDLENKKIGTVTEWGPSVSSRSLRIAHKKRVGALMSRGGGSRSRGDGSASTLQMYDLRTGRKIAEAHERFRPRRSLVAISPEGDKVYVGTAGSDFEVFDAKLQRLKTVELDGEIWGRIFVVDG